MKRVFALLLAVMFVGGSVFAASKASTDTGYLGNDQWAVRTNGDIEPISGSGKIVGATMSGELADIEVGVTDDTIGAAESGRIFVCTANSDKTLPTAANGLIYTFVDGGGCTITVDTGVTTDTIMYLTLDAGDAIDSPGATGDSITLVGDGDNAKWYAFNMSGTWTDGGAD